MEINTLNNTFNQNDRGEKDGRTVNLDNHLAILKREMVCTSNRWPALVFMYISVYIAIYELTHFQFDSSTQRSLVSVNWISRCCLSCGR